MLTWDNILTFTDKGNPTPDRTVRKTDQEWRTQLTDEQYWVTRQHGTEEAFSSDMCSLFEPGIYACVCCATLLFDADDKFESRTGWPSFTQPIKENAIAYYGDNSYDMRRIETLCNTCEAHLGHVFPDGPESSGLRYCMNAVALKKIEASLEKATFGGGCFWCTEAIFQQLRGVLSVESGYSGGHIDNPSYRAVCDGTTGHAEVIQVIFDPDEITYKDLLRIHLSTHNPTTLSKEPRSKLRGISESKFHLSLVQLPIITSLALPLHIQEPSRTPPLPSHSLPSAQSCSGYTSAPTAPGNARDPDPFQSPKSKSPIASLSPNTHL